MVVPSAAGMRRNSGAGTPFFAYVSGAAGAVGSLAGQVARLLGARRVIGIAGGAEKCQFLVDELGFDAAVDYKAGDVSEKLSEVAPDGVDVFWDNVGGDVLDAVLMNLAVEARVVLCGAVSQYENMSDVRGPRNYLKIAERDAKMLGFTIFHYPGEYADATATMAGWLKSGKLKVHEHVIEGLELFPSAIRAGSAPENTISPPCSPAPPRPASASRPAWRPPGMGPSPSPVRT